MNEEDKVEVVVEVEEGARRLMRASTCRITSMSLRESLGPRWPPYLMKQRQRQRQRKSE